MGKVLFGLLVFKDKHERIALKFICKNKKELTNLEEKTEKHLSYFKDM